MTTSPSFTVLDLKGPVPTQCTRISSPYISYASGGYTQHAASVNIVFHVGLGIFLAVILNERFIVGKPAWRVLLILPWAVPQYITALTWRGMFNFEYGAVNLFLAKLGAGPVAFRVATQMAHRAGLAERDVMLAGEIEVSQGERSDHLQPGDAVIIFSYASYEERELENYEPTFIFVDAENRIATSAARRTA